MKTHR